MPPQPRPEFVGPWRIERWDGGFTWVRWYLRDAGGRRYDPQNWTWMIAATRFRIPG